MKLESGDYLEVHFKDFIQQNIPAYESIWAQFIGHDGNGKMISWLGFSKEDQKKRINFAECHYTCIESLICMNSICKSIKTVDTNNPDQYLDMLNKFIAFQAHAGRIRDNTKVLLKFYLSFNQANNLLNRLEDTYQRRNNVLHSKKLPFKIEDSLVLIAPIKGANESDKGWHSSMNWADFKESDLVILQDYLTETLQELCSTFNDILSNLIEPINKIVSSNGIKIVSLTNTTEQTNFNASGFVTPMSASSYVYSFNKKGPKKNKK